MIKVKNIKLPVDFGEDTIKSAISKSIKVNPKQIADFSLHRLSIDARDKSDVHYIATVVVSLGTSEKSVLSKCKNTEKYIPYVYNFVSSKKLTSPPVVVGSGPAGLFAALILAQNGANPIVLERGKDVDSRTKDVNNFFKCGILDTGSNIQFGEGGAGTFSDGKLNTGTNDSRATHVLRTFVEHGAQKDILVNAKPHIGTDVLKKVIKNIRHEIISLGGEFLFETKLTDIIVKNKSVTSIKAESPKGLLEIETNNVILAIGHSARDTFEMLLSKDILLEQKAFSVGVRIEHRAEDINKSQYGKFANILPTADYKLNMRCKSGRGVYTFCMCPGGYVVNASSEDKMLCTNGMSYSKRDGNNSNSAVLVGVTPEDFGNSSPLAGIEFQLKIESAAYSLGGESYLAPVETVGSFVFGDKNEIKNVIPTIEPGFVNADISKIFPEFINESLKEGIVAFSKRLDAFNDRGAVITGAETRSSSPVRILRNENNQSVSVRGLFPCGEGAGYAGGIISAAVDGIKCAEKLLTE